MTLYDEWVRTAIAFEKCKEKLEESEKALETVAAEIKQAEAERNQAEAEKRLMEYLLNQNRFDDLKKVFKDPAYKEKLLEELNQ